MIREILKMGDPRLLRIADPVDHFDTPELHELVKDMFETMHDANGAGLAAPQSANRLEQFLFRHVLQQIPVRSRLQRLREKMIGVLRSQKQDFGPFCASRDLSRCFQSI